MKVKNYAMRLCLILTLIVAVLISCSREETNYPVLAPEKKGFILSEAQMQLANITVAEARKGVISNEVLLTGILKVNEQSVASISSSVAGRIQKLYFKNTGDLVNKEAALYDLYSEDLLALEREFKAIQDNNWNSQRRSDISLAAENKLLLAGMLPSQIAEIYKTRALSPIVTIYSPERGLIRSVNITEGQYVNIGENLFELADDSKLWVEAQVYPNELQLLKPGTHAEVIIPGAGEMHIPNRISFINPAFEPGTNITIVRAIIDNPGKMLHPGMLALMSIHTDQSEGIIIPASALLVDKLGSHVWIRNEDGTFESRNVKTGIQSPDSVLVVDGLQGSEQVVVSGSYLLNSERILKKSYESTANAAIPGND
jgi:membrane fusion protein, copper/silver efflux system